MDFLYTWRKDENQFKREEVEKISFSIVTGNESRMQVCGKAQTTDS